MRKKITLPELLEDIKDIWRHCLFKSNGKELTLSYLSLNPMQQPYSVLAIGKASCAMTAGAILHNKPEKCLVITKHGHVPAKFRHQHSNMRVLEAGHPIPDEYSIQAGLEILKFCNHTEEDSILCLISGGSSSLAEVPAEGYDYETIRLINRQLIGSGKSVAALNRQRKKYSKIKGGGLARLLNNKKVLALYLSDVEGNDTAIIGSGMLTDSTIPHPDLQEKILADNYTGCLFAAAAAAEKNYSVRCHDFFLNQSVEKTAQHIAKEIKETPGFLHIWGGEPTVKLPPIEGRGGRNQHLALLMAKELADSSMAVFSSLGTDGTDGNTNYAGAIVTNKTMDNIKKMGLDYAKTIRDANSAALLEKIDAILETGPTGTNLMDLVIAYRR